MNTATVIREAQRNENSNGNPYVQIQVQLDDGVKASQFEDPGTKMGDYLETLDQGDVVEIRERTQKGRYTNVKLGKVVMTAEEREELLEEFNELSLDDIIVEAYVDSRRAVIENEYINEVLENLEEDQQQFIKDVTTTVFIQKSRMTDLRETIRSKYENQ